MPELPEVETVRRDLHRLLRGQWVKNVSVNKEKMVRGSTSLFKRNLRGLLVQGVKRRGKLLIFSMTDGKSLLVHMKMTGQMIYQSKQTLVGGGHGQPRVKRDELPNKYTHVVIVFGDGARLFFNDMRQFGYMRLVNAKQLEQVVKRFGVEPLSKAFTPDKLRRLVRGRKTSLKNVLLDQRGVAGLGNIYVDELCFLAGVRPMRRADKVTDREIVKLHKAAINVLKRAIAARGTTFNSYRDGLGGEGKFVRMLKVYGRSGKLCVRCKTILKRVKIGGRGTVYCPVCQK